MPPTRCAHRVCAAVVLSLLSYPVARQFSVRAFQFPQNVLTSYRGHGRLLKAVIE